MASPISGSPAVPCAPLPEWAARLADLYESNAANQFLIFGNIEDRMPIPSQPPRLGTLSDFLLQNLLANFAVVLSYDLGNGIRIEKGGQIFQSWPQAKEGGLPKAPRQAIETLTHYFRYCANLARLNRDTIQVACIIKGLNLIAPATGGSLDYDLGALVTLIRDWSGDSLLTGHPLASFLIAENVNDVHPLIARNPRAALIQVPLPSQQELKGAFELMAPRFPVALGQNAGHFDTIAGVLTGATLSAAESLLKTRERAGQSLTPDDLVRIKKQIVEKDNQGLIDFVESKRTLDTLQGHGPIKEWLRQDIALWKANDLAAMPKGYLICGPVGTGKSFMVECLAGEAGVPVVKLKNFRDKWVGSTEGNLERIFRLLRALGRCYVFVDEADQALGKRESGGDSGVSGRVYSMIAEEMGSSESRGRIVWVLASSRPDLIEVDLKRPGRVDVKIPLFPTANAREGFDLIRFLCRTRSAEIPEDSFNELAPMIPSLLTPGAAEALAVKVYRLMRTRSMNSHASLRACLENYRHPVSREMIEYQIGLAVAEATDPSFIPAEFAEKVALP